MTSGATKAVPEASDDTESAEPTYWATYAIGGRDIHFNMATPEQLMVLRRLARQLGDPGNEVGRQITTMAKILDAISACMSSDEERDFVDQLVLDRVVGIDELAPLIRAALAGPAKEEKPKGPARRVRRR